MVTARDVAARAGTSTAVVSYVFNDGPRGVAPDTRARVLAAADELGYRPNQLARALSFGRTSTIGFLVPDISNPFFGELAHELEDAAHARGHLLLIGDAGLDIERERKHVAAFVERQVDSVVMVSLLDEPDLSAFDRARIPVVALHPIDARYGIPSVTIDYEAAARTATEHLVAHGYGSIGLFYEHGETVGSHQHERGFAAAIAAAKTPVATSRRRCPVSRGRAMELALQWLAEDDRPRAIYAATDEQAYGVLAAAYRLGIRIPEELAVVGLDGTSHSAYSVPPLATVRQPIAGIARRAIELLVSDAGAEPVAELLDYSFLPRDSCGCREVTER